MSKRKATVILSIIIVLMLLLLLFTIPLNGEDYFKIGKSNYDFYWISTAIDLGLDLKGGMYAEYSADTKDLSDPEGAMDGALTNLETLLFNKGYTEAIVTKEGSDRIRVEVPNIEDTETLMALIGKPAELEFRNEAGEVVIEGGKHLDSVGTQANNDGYFDITLKFNSEGTERFAKATETAYNNSETISIYIDDKEVMSPKVSAVITDGNAIVQGNYDQETAESYAVQIQAGASEVKLELLSSETVSPTLGSEALEYSIIAALVGIILICILLMVLYKGFGICASIALIAYTELLILFLAIVPWVQLTINGIAGVILSIGMAVDANVVIFERIKEDKAIGNRSIPSSVKSGFKRALITVFDSNITTILGAIVMIIFGVSAIKSFAITLLIGIVLSFLTAIFITRLLIKCFMAFNDESETFYGLKVKEEI